MKTPPRKATPKTKTTSKSVLKTPPKKPLARQKVGVKPLTNGFLIEVGEGYYLSQTKGVKPAGKIRISQVVSPGNLTQFHVRLSSSAQAASVALSIRAYFFSVTQSGAQLNLSRTTSTPVTAYFDTTAGYFTGIASVTLTPGQSQNYDFKLDPAVFQANGQDDTLMGILVRGTAGGNVYQGAVMFSVIV